MRAPGFRRSPRQSRSGAGSPRLWRVDAPHGHEVHTTPDASIDIVIVANEAFDGIFVGGPLRTFSRRALKGEMRLAGLSLRPGLGALIGISAEALPADWTPLAELELSGAKVAPEEASPAFFVSSKRVRKRLGLTRASPKRSRVWSRADPA